MQTFRDLQLEVLRVLDEAEDTDTTLTLVKEAINRSHRQLLGERTWPFMLWPREESFTTTAGVRAYALKSGVSKVLTLVEQESGSFYPLISRREWEAEGVDRVNTTDWPRGAIYGDVWPVAAQPAGAVVSAVSPDNTGANTLTVILRGYDSDYNEATETLAVVGTGTTMGTVLWRHLASVTKTGTWLGTLTLASGGTTLLTLTSTQYGKQYPTLEFIESPSAPRTYLYTAQRTPLLLTSDYDVPDTPYPYCGIHVYDALLDMTVYNSEMGQKHADLWRSRRQALWNALTESVDERIAGSRPRFVRSLGGVSRSPGRWNA